MDEETLVYILTAIMIALVPFLILDNFGTYKAAAILISIFTILAVVLINYADFLIFPALTYLTRRKIVPAKDHVIPRSQNCVIKSESGLYYATGYLTANVYSYVFTVEQIDTTEEGKLALAPEKWERIVMSLHFPFKYRALLFAKEIQEYREDIEAKRGLYEYQLSKEQATANPSQLTIDDLQRKINVMQARIDRLSGGERPIGSVMYIETTAVGVSEKAATDKLTTQLDQLQTVFNSMDVSISRVMGREVYLLFKFGYQIPSDANQVQRLFHIQR